mgnify:CR=1 FL=1|jgi:hypothetical protein
MTRSDENPQNQPNFFKPLLRDIVSPRHAMVKPIPLVGKVLKTVCKIVFVATTGVLRVQFV